MPLASVIEGVIGREHTLWRNGHSNVRLSRRQFWNGARACWPSNKFRLRVPTRPCQVDWVWSSTKGKLHSVVARQKTCLKCADLFLNQMPVVVTEPNISGRGRRDDNQLVVHGLDFRLRHDVRSLCAIIFSCKHSSLP